MKELRKMYGGGEWPNCGIGVLVDIFVCGRRISCAHADSCFCSCWYLVVVGLDDSDDVRCDHGKIFPSK